ncbi:MULTISPECIES: putative lipid II flippase FtsW [Parachlamydia]|uniref:putative lipid II flippase FtsW n=1 Tax=Parachlamydia TaxID=83551 RepID=UPI0001C17934|nr:putative lipid II flippase FtsW [Parachlamydia acanthamoebae]EFB40837.1 hypothetical protein pah_c180o015 [Parachlamydia acanthamoebae str. Hall's coccus]
MRLLLLLCTSLIFTFGLIMIFSTTSAEVLDHDLQRSTHQALIRQMAYSTAGFALAFGVWKVGYHRFLKYSPLLLALFSFFLVITLIPGIGREVNGSRRWLAIGGLTFQPSEFVKYILPAFFIERLMALDRQALSLKDLLKLATICAIPILLILVEPNNGTAAVIGLTLIALCLVTRIPVKYWALPLICLSLIAIGSAYHLSYVSARLKVYLDPSFDLQGKGHQPHQAKIAAGSGKLFGKGPGNSWQKLSYLPEAQNDYIAAIFAEEFGFIGMLGLILLYMFLAYLGFAIANQAQDFVGFYFGSAVTFLICFQAFLNLGVVSGLVPSTGLNLPLFSQGGTSLIANLMGIALLYSISTPVTQSNISTSPFSEKPLSRNPNRLHSF